MKKSVIVSKRDTSTIHLLRGLIHAFEKWSFTEVKALALKEAPRM